MQACPPVGSAPLALKAYDLPVPQGEADQIIGQITDATVDLVDRNLELVRRVVGMGDPDQPVTAGGPAEQIWKAWTESAGDLVQISYLAAQLADSLWDRGRSPGDD